MRIVYHQPAVEETLCFSWIQVYILVDWLENLLLFRTGFFVSYCKPIMLKTVKMLSLGPHLLD